MHKIPSIYIYIYIPNWTLNSTNIIIYCLCLCFKRIIFANEMPYLCVFPIFFNSTQFIIGLSWSEPNWDKILGKRIRFYATAIFILAIKPCQNFCHLKNLNTNSFITFHTRNWGRTTAPHCLIKYLFIQLLHKFTIVLSSGHS